MKQTCGRATYLVKNFFLLLLCFFSFSSVYAFRTDPQPKRCDGSTCVAGGTGIHCVNNDDCNKLYCKNSTQSCASNGSGKVCDLFKYKEQCSEKHCQQGVCVVGADPRYGVPCNNNSDCDVLRCTPYGACMKGGTREPCTESPNNCAQTRCDLTNQTCHANGSGGACSADSDCKNPATSRCTGAGVCATSSDITLTPCSSNKDCDYSVCKAEYCVRGLDPATVDSRKLCTSDPNCRGVLTCWTGQCSTAYGGTASCTGSGDCNHQKCDGTNCVGLTVPGQSMCGPGNPCPSRLPAPGSSNEWEAIGVDPNSLEKANETSLIVSPLLETASFVGDAKAKVTVMAFQDLRCGMCKKAHKQFFAQLKKEFIDTKKARVAFIEYPLVGSVDEMALANAALCAGEQGHYLPYLEKIYNNYEKASAKTAVQLSKGVVKDQKAFKSCMAKAKYHKAINKNRELAAKAGINGTPTFLVNGMKAQGAHSYAGIRLLIAKAEKEGALPKKHISGLTHLKENLVGLLKK